MRTINMTSSTIGNRRLRLPFRAELRHLSSLCFPILYQALFTYVVVLADLVTPELGIAGFVAFAIFGIVASSLASLWLLKSKRFKASDFRVALPMIAALLLPLIQIALLNAYR